MSGFKGNCTYIQIETVDSNLNKFTYEWSGDDKPPTPQEILDMLFDGKYIAQERTDYVCKHITCSPLQVLVSVV